MQGAGGVVVEPGSVREGETVDVAYDGPGTLYYQVDLGAWEKVSLDPETGKGEVVAPGGASVIIFSDRRGARSASTSVEVFSTSE
ncbi:MAG: hypothetical protein AAF628_09520 [Planctomycetota bacterium]